MVRPVMRAVLLTALVAGSALADPAPKPVMPKIPLLPPLDPQPLKLEDATKLLPEGWLDFSKGLTPGTTTVHPSLNGGTSLGIVVDPGPHPDAQPWPRGMLITPPDVHDPMAIQPGKRSGESLGKKLLNGVDDGVDKLFQLVLPNGS